MSSMTEITSPRVRVIDLGTAGTGRFDVCEVGSKTSNFKQTPCSTCQGRVVRSWSILARDFGRQAVHHLIDANVPSAPFWKASHLAYSNPPVAFVPSRLIGQDRDPDIRFSARTELRRRGEAAVLPQPHPLGEH